MSTIRNARLTDGRRVDIRIEAGRIAEIVDHRPVEPAASGGAAGSEAVDVDGWLLLPAMVEPHAHLDKALTAERVPNPTGDLPGAIDAWIAAAQTGMFTHDDMVMRIRAALEKLLVSGVTAVRSHVNTGATAGIAHLVAAQEAVEPFAGLVDVQLVALTNSPIVGPGSEANASAMTAAIEAGVDLVGGCPALEPAGAASIADALARADAAGIGVDLHVDETLDITSLTLRELARQVTDSGFGGRVAASHCVSLGMQPPEVQAEVAREVAGAGIAVIPLPQTNLFLQGRDHPVAPPRGLTALHALGDAGVLLAAGADNVQDPFNLVGRSDPLETAALMVMAGHVLPDEAYDMVSNNGRRALGLDPVRFERGDPADFVAIDAPSIRGAIADAPANRKTFRGGRLVAESSTSATVHTQASSG
ncbi:MAG: amidohydrolase family protein [Ilumatobacter sp.]|uniref:amidohydrolase family protein n=1 Tax=Ilumatobacter sp. TaxID=1967498 RepID=UPI00261684C9|nr:amidohydrolase family protein [Ilumatobacter sp.]MDJ0767284.1 amidohydrolase family protein [Ilumatobacter sp.]